MGQINPDEHMLLDDNKYIADVLYEVKNSKQKDLLQSRLLFKKRMFRETDETITEAQFVNLSYVQVPLLIPKHLKLLRHLCAITVVSSNKSHAWLHRHVENMTRSESHNTCSMLWLYWYHFSDYDRQQFRCHADILTKYCKALKCKLLRHVCIRTCICS